MLVSLALLLAFFWLLGRLLRGAIVGVVANGLRRGRPPVPLAFTLRSVPVPAGDTLLFAARASVWEPAPAGGGGRAFAVGRRGRLVFDGGRPRYEVAGRARAAGGLLVVTDRRVLFRGRRAAGRAAGATPRDVREDVLLGDVAHLRLEGPLLAVERRSRPAAPLVVRVATAAPVANLVAAAAQAAAGVRPAAARR
jgi:hypothetical protein